MREPRIARISSGHFGEQVLAVEADLPPSIRPPGSGTRRRIDRHVIDLPEPDSPTMPERLAVPHGEARAVHRLHDPAPRVDVGTEVADIEQRVSQEGVQLGAFSRDRVQP